MSFDGDPRLSGGRDDGPDVAGSVEALPAQASPGRPDVDGQAGTACAVLALHRELCRQRRAQPLAMGIFLGGAATRRRGHGLGDHDPGA